MTREHAMASEEEVADILQPMKGEGNYIATTPLLTMKCNQGGLSSSLEECLDKEYISHGHAIDKGNCILGLHFLTWFSNHMSSKCQAFLLNLFCTHKEKATNKQSSEQISHWATLGILYK